MPPFRDVLPQNSEFWEACARHTNRQTARTIQAIYLCDECAARLTHEAFNDRPPIYHGESTTGFCGLCNEQKTVTLRVWFVCNFCWNVVVAYQKGFVASQSIHSYWQTTVSQRFSELKLSETEEMYLSPYSRKGKTKKAVAVTLTELDFLVKEQHGTESTPLFHIELKAGPGSIEEMKEFQLDINDSNDIIGVANNTKLPVYVFHVKLEHLYAPPTRSTVAAGIWWTDIFTLLEHRLAVRARRGEEKKAGYYDPNAFKSIDQFFRELETRRYAQLRERLVRRPLELT